MVKLRCFILLYFLVFFAPSVFAQSDSIVYLKYPNSKNKATTKDSAEYYVLLNQNDSLNGIVTAYYIEGSKYSQCLFKNKLKDGEEIIWKKEGRIREKGFYSKGKKNGIHYYYPADTNYYNEDLFDNGNFISGHKLTKNGGLVFSYDVLETPAEFPGGVTAMMKYISSNIVYPKSEIRAGIQGKVMIRFDIDESGNVVNVKIHKGVSEAIDQEALRVISSMPTWKPALQRNEFVKMKMMLPIRFTLPE